MGTNELEIDEAAIIAEAAAVEVPDSSSPGEVEGTAGVATTSAAPAAMPESSWAPATPMLVLALDRAVCPNWKLTEEEKHELAGALGAVLDQLFPGGMGDERWAPYLRLVAVAGGIAAARFHEGRFMPLRAPTVDGESGEGGAAPAMPRAPRPFTTAGGG